MQVQTLFTWFKLATAR